MNYNKIEQIQFPKPNGLNINMMPIIMGDDKSVPDFAKPYVSIINKCKLGEGTIAYLTVNEGVVEKGKTQRRPGIHTDGTKVHGWGVGCDGNKGIYFASTDGRCKVWDCQSYNVDYMEEIKALDMPGKMMDPNMLYWITDYTPHEAMPSLKTEMRQFFRLVSEDIGIWWAKHSTANPLDVQPNCNISHEDKFKHGN